MIPVGYAINLDRSITSMKNFFLVTLILLCSQVCLGQSAGSTSDTTPAGITQAMLDKAPDSELERIVMDALSERVNKDLAREYDVIKTLSKGQRAVYITWVLENEVTNGGFFQFFRNTPDQFAELALEGIQVLGATPFEDIMQEASETYNEMKPDLDVLNLASLQLLSKKSPDEPLHEVDAEFQSMNERQSLSAFRIKYIRSHKDEFVSK